MLKGAAPALGGIIGGAIGGPPGAAIGGSVGGAISRGGGSGPPTRMPGRGGSRGSGRVATTGIAAQPPERQQRQFDFEAGGGGFRLPGGAGLDFPSFGFGSGSETETGGTPSLPMQSGGGLPGAFSGALGAKMLEKSVRSKSGRAILEAMQSGSLSAGMIQRPVTVQTPRGVEKHSPPGFRTVTVNGEKFAVFKPLAQALGLLPKRSRCVVSGADKKAIRKADRLTKKMKKLAQDTGRLKVTNK